ncbi:MAG: hypothetical protein LUE24_12975 [Lachnospiraceae bacterium]|nr:hypothetical protein [Lachnospiraceae bacterium]
MAADKKYKYAEQKDEKKKQAARKNPPLPSPPLLEFSSAFRSLPLS